MALNSMKMLDRLAQLRNTRKWARAAYQASEFDLEQLRQLRTQARGLRSHLDRLLFHADERLALPAEGSNRFKRPQGTEWAWRPDLWRGRLDKPGLSSVQSREKMGAGVTLFHDCRHSELTLRQLRNRREADLAPYGLQMDVFRFDGSFLSLVVDLPRAASDGLNKSHIIRMECIIEMEKPIEIFARLNVKHGPNTEQIVRELPRDGAQVMVEFDLAYSNLNEKRVEKAWIDLIFEGPEMNQVTIRDLTFLRRPRANL